MLLNAIIKESTGNPGFPNLPCNLQIEVSISQVVFLLFLLCYWAIAWLCLSCIMSEILQLCQDSWATKPSAHCPLFGQLCISHFQLPPPNPPFPPPPPPPTGNCRAFACLVNPREEALPNFVHHRGQAFANHRATTRNKRTWFLTPNPNIAKHGGNLQEKTKWLACLSSIKKRFWLVYFLIFMHFVIANTAKTVLARSGAINVSWCLVWSLNQSCIDQGFE